MLKWIRDNIADWKHCVIVSPDAGGAKRYMMFQALSLLLMYKALTFDNQYSCTATGFFIYFMLGAMKDKIAISPVPSKLEFVSWLHSNCLILHLYI